jgi:hypothetical protein
MKIKLLFFLTLFVAFFVFRLSNLLNQSPFTDEAYYVYLSSLIRENVSFGNLFLPIQVGLSPLFIYATSGAMLFLKNPIFAGRTTSIILSLSSFLVFSAYLCKIKSRNFILPLAFFLFNPFFFLYSQMATLEITMIFFVIIFMLVTEIAISSKKIFAWSFLLMINLYLVIFSKATGVFIIFYTLARFLQEKKYRNLRVFIIMIIAGGIVFFPILKLLFLTVKMHGQSNMISFRHFFDNTRLITIWMVDYFKPAFFLLLILIVMFYRRNKIISSAVFTLLATIFATIISSANFFPRYLIVIVPLLSLIFSCIRNKKIIFLILLLFIILYLKTDYNIIFNLRESDIAKEDVYQYSIDWTSGNNVLNILSRTNKSSKICISKEYFSYFKIANASYFQSKNLQIMNCKTGLTPMAL